MLRPLRLLASSTRSTGVRTLLSITSSSLPSPSVQEEKRRERRGMKVINRNYVVLFHPPESDKKKLSAEEEELQMEIGDDYDENDEVFSEESETFDDVRFDFSTISYDNYIPGGNSIRSYLQEDDELVDGSGNHYMTNEEQQEMDAAIEYHGSDVNYGYRLEHETPRDKRKRIANRRRGLKSARKVYALVSYLEMKKSYCAPSWANADKQEMSTPTVTEESTVAK